MSWSARTILRRGAGCKQNDRLGLRNVAQRSGKLNSARETSQQSSRARALSTRFDVHGRWFAVLVLYDVVAELLPLLERSELGLPGLRRADEYVLRSILRLNKAESPEPVEPFDCADRHGRSPLDALLRNREWPKRTVGAAEPGVGT